MKKIRQYRVCVKAYSYFFTESKIKLLKSYQNILTDNFKYDILNTS